MKFVDVDLSSQVALKGSNYLLWMGMNHHGIYLGDRTIIHLSGEKKNNVRVTRSNIHAFFNGLEFYCVDYSLYKVHNRLRPIVRDKIEEFLATPEKNPSEVIKDALESLCKDVKYYDPMTFNCEHFSTYLKRGIPISFQVLERVNESLRATHTSFGAMTAVLLDLPQFLFRNIPQEKVGGKYVYVGSIYRCNGQILKESYINSRNYIFPQWFIMHKGQECELDYGSLRRYWPLEEKAAILARDWGSSELIKVDPWELTEAAIDPKFIGTDVMRL